MFRVQGAGFRVQGAGCRVQGAGFRVYNVGIRVVPDVVAVERDGGDCRLGYHVSMGLWT